MDGQTMEEYLRKLESLKNRSGEIDLEEIVKSISEMKLPPKLQSYLIEKISVKGNVLGPFPGAIGFSPRKSINWAIEKIRNYKED